MFPPVFPRRVAGESCRERLRRHPRRRARWWLWMYVLKWSILLSHGPHSPTPILTAHYRPGRGPRRRHGRRRVPRPARPGGWRRRCWLPRPGCARVRQPRSSSFLLISRRPVRISLSSWYRSTPLSFSSLSSHPNSFEPNEFEFHHDTRAWDPARALGQPALKNSEAAFIFLVPPFCIAWVTLVHPLASGSPAGMHGCTGDIMSRRWNNAVGCC